MTKTGVTFIITGFFIYLIASQTQIGWLYLFDVIIWSLLLLSVILPWLSLKALNIERQILLSNLTINQTLLNGPLEDETIDIRLKVTNHGYFSKNFIKIIEDCPFEQPEKRQQAFLLANIKAKSFTSFQYKVTCYKRGVYSSSNTTIQANGPLGLVIWKRKFQLPLKLIIYPKYYRMTGIPAGNTTWADSGNTVKTTSATELYGSREYQYGDPLKHIHWRNTARTGQFMLKEFEQSNQGSITIIFSTTHDFGEGRDTTLEYSIKVVASLAKLYTDSGHSLNIIAGKNILRNAEWQETMEYLAHLNLSEKASEPEMATIPEPGQTIVAIVPVIETKSISKLLKLSNRAQNFVVILLEDFTSNEEPDKFIRLLKSKHINIIRCSRGNLEETIKELDNSLSPVSSYSRVVI
ncbi:DUF58 domain-containing protein [Chloroflexota bacterium]